jgi:hypothetical protein
MARLTDIHRQQIVGWPWWLPMYICNVDLSPPLEEKLLQALHNRKNDCTKGQKYMHGIWICHLFCHFFVVKNTTLMNGKTAWSWSICHNHHDVRIILPSLEKSRPWLLIIPQKIVSLKHCINNFHLTTMKNHDWLLCTCK